MHILYGILTSIHLAMVQLSFARACSGGGVWGGGRGEGLDGERLARELESVTNFGHDSTSRVIRPRNSLDTSMNRR